MDNPLIDLETFLQSPTIKYILSQLPDNNNFLKEDATVHSIVLRLEHTLRFHGAHLIHQACSLLKL